MIRQLAYRVCCVIFSLYALWCLFATAGALQVFDRSTDSCILVGTSSLGFLAGLMTALVFYTESNKRGPL